MKTLLIDNYDSFTFNLFQLIAEVNRVTPIVVRNDAAPWSEIRRLEFDNVVISPGPGRPEREGDFGIGREAILESDVPVLGVCLGHQGLCHAMGATVDLADAVSHGRPSGILHTGTDLFEGIPSPFTAIRYHSLLVRELPPELERLAWTDDGTLMAVRHEGRPLWGVQFHPESIGTEHGRRLLENFRSLTTRHLESRGPRPVSVTVGRNYDVLTETLPGRSHEDPGPCMLDDRPVRLYHRRLPKRLDPEAVFLDHFGDSKPAFWLDNALEGGLSRFSYMGDASGPHAEYLTYDVADEAVRVVKNGEERTVTESFLPYLDRMLRERRLHTADLPFDFTCGYVGYLGYELKAECGADQAHRAETPDAAFVFADRLIVFDHEDGLLHLVCLDYDDAEGEARAQFWLNEMLRKLERTSPSLPLELASRPEAPAVDFRHDPEAYLGLIDECRKAIRSGETYEICLTNRIRVDVRIDSVDTYRALRRSNPAAYAALLHFPEVAALSSSPERFLTIDPYGRVEARPIKGTRRRGGTLEEDRTLYEDLRTSEKDRSENLMIVDLLRNDIGMVCEVGSVQVHDMFTVETYATVHQLVSTVRGRLRRGVSAVDCVRAAFPGGSMTGAPKKRTMEIIDRLEAGPRGVYSGSIGFFGLNGSADLSIVIRTIVVTDEDVTVGVGGAILDLSDPGDELDEILLKAEAPLAAISRTARRRRPIGIGTAAEPGSCVSDRDASGAPP